MTHQTIKKNARQYLSPISCPAPQNSTSGIAPCSNRCCCSLQEGRRKVGSSVRWALRTASHLRPSASVLPVLQMQIATPGKQLEMLFIFGLVLKKFNKCILYQVAKVTYPARECITHALGTSVARAEEEFFFCLQWEGQASVTSPVCPVLLFWITSSIVSQ